MTPPTNGGGDKRENITRGKDLWECPDQRS